MIKKISLKLVYMLVLSLVLTSCTGKTGSKDDGEDIILQPETGNVIKLAIDDTDTLNPILTKSTSVKDAMQLIFEPLFRFDSSLNPVCALAESCNQSEDGLSYTIKVRQGVLWHDGTLVTAADVVHTINLIRYNDSEYTSSLSCISAISKTDDQTVMIRLARPVPNFCALLTFPIVQNSRATEAGADYKPIGTGPFKYDDKITSDVIRLLVNENWRGSKPSVSEIHLNLMKNPNDIINAFNASEVDAITSTVMDIKTNAIRGEVNSYDYVSNKMTFVGFNVSSSVFGGNNTRKAVSYLADRQDIVTNEIFSRAEAARIPVNPSAWYSPKISDSKYERDYIEETLALDGWKLQENGQFTRSVVQTNENGEEIQSGVTEKLACDIIVNDDNDERYRIATNIADSLNAFGIETTVTILSYEDYAQRIADKNYSMFIGEVKLSGNMDCYSLLAASDNYFGYSSGNMNSAIYKLGTGKTLEETAAAFSEYASVFTEDMPFIPLFFRKETVYFAKNLSGTSAPNMFTAYCEPGNWYIINGIKTDTEINMNENADKK